MKQAAKNVYLTIKQLSAHGNERVAEACLEVNGYFFPLASCRQVVVPQQLGTLGEHLLEHKLVKGVMLLRKKNEHSRVQSLLVHVPVQRADGEQLTSPTEAERQSDDFEGPVGKYPFGREETFHVLLRGECECLGCDQSPFRVAILKFVEEKQKRLGLILILGGLV